MRTSGRNPRRNSSKRFKRFTEVVEVSEVMLSGSAASSLYRQVCARRRLRKALARGRPVILLQAGGLSGEGSARPSGKDRHAGSTAPCRRVSSRVDWSQALVVDLPYGELSSAPHRTAPVSRSTGRNGPTRKPRRLRISAAGRRASRCESGRQKRHWRCDVSMKGETHE